MVLSTTGIDSLKNLLLKFCSKYGIWSPCFGRNRILHWSPHFKIKNTVLQSIQDELLLFGRNKSHREINICSCGITGILHLKRNSYQPIWLYLLVISLTSENIPQQINSKRICAATFNLYLTFTSIWIWNAQLKRAFYILQPLFLRLLYNLYLK